MRGPYGPPPDVALPDRFGDRTEGDRLLAPGARQVVVVTVWAAGPGLEPLTPQAETVRELMQQLQGIGLEMPAASPEAPVAGHEGIVDIDARHGRSGQLDVIGLGGAGEGTSQAKLKQRGLGYPLDPRSV